MNIRTTQKAVSFARRPEEFYLVGAMQGAPWQRPSEIRSWVLALISGSASHIQQIENPE